MKISEAGQGLDEYAVFVAWLIGILLLFGFSEEIIQAILAALGLS